MLSSTLPALFVLLALTLSAFAVSPERKQSGPVRLTKEVVRSGDELLFASKPEDVPVADRSRRGSLDDVIFSETFEGTVPGSVPFGWSRTDVDEGYSTQWGRSSLWQVMHYGRANARSGSHVAMIHYNDGAVANNDWLILPQIAGGAPIVLEYWAASQDPAYLESWEVRVSTTGTEPGDFTNLIETVQTAPVTWTHHLLSLDAFAATPFYVAFHYNAADRFVLKLDDIELSAGSLGVAGGISGLTRRRITDTTSVVISDMSVQLLNRDLRTSSNIAGQYEFNFLPPGNYDLRFTHPLYDPYILSGVQVVSGQVTDSVTVVLSRIDTVLRNYRYNSANIPDISDFDTARASLNVTQSFVVRDIDVSVWIAHTWVGDLDIWVEGPAGRSARLAEHDITLSGDSLTATRFNDEAGGYFTQGEAPFTGSFIPQERLSVFDSASVNGTWSVAVYDNYEDDFGQILDFTIHAQGVPADGIQDTDPIGHLPNDFAFDGNYPNPFNATTTFAFSLPKNSPVTLTLYNLNGQAVRTLLDETTEAGSHTISFSANTLASGIYLARFTTPEFSATHKVVLLK